MLRDAARYPFAGSRADEAMVLGWVLYLVAGVVPVAPLVLLVGYFVRVLGASARGTGTPPPLDGPWRLLKQSLVGTALLAAFAAVPLALSVGTAGGLRRAPAPSGLLDVLVVLGGGTTLLLVTLVFGYLAPAALAGYGLTGRPRTAFDRHALRRAGTHAAYFLRWWLGTVTFVTSLSLLGWLWSVHPLARIVAPLPVVYLQVVACRLWGVGFGAAARDYLRADDASASDPSVGDRRPAE